MLSVNKALVKSLKIIVSLSLLHFFDNATIISKKNPKHNQALVWKNK
ncbi:hypothetical protein M23134_00662 [Microscilla marina ATCC 23134]|uniref:Uncharacterized protein n=1 Tax=Microscilla marina ATCC 23134 TaxID=313606 RepID=A1ZVM0_MICM2|nr:hypothetical protein M23134_00662 [Microscilla marina ATCC 23134]